MHDIFNSAQYVQGNTYIIDAKYANGGPVILVKLHGKIFCRVKDSETGSEWDTMISRLSEPQTQK